MLNVSEFIMSQTKEVTKTFLTGKLSATLVIPIEIARRNGLEKPAYVIVEERPEGILIKKLVI
jgi:adenosine deaminase